MTSIVEDGVILGSTGATLTLTAASCPVHVIMHRTPENPLSGLALILRNSIDSSTDLQAFIHASGLIRGFPRDVNMVAKPNRHWIAPLSLSLTLTLSWFITSSSIQTSPFFP